MSKKTSKFENLSQRDLADGHGVTPRAIQAWDKRGHAAAARNADGTYALQKSIRWRLAAELHGGLSLNGEKARLARAQADKAELDLAARAGQVLDGKLVVNRFGRLLIGMRSHLLRLPYELTPQIAPVMNSELARRTFKVIKDGIYDALTHISSEEFVHAINSIQGDQVEHEDTGTDPQQQDHARSGGQSAETDEGNVA